MMKKQADFQTHTKEDLKEVNLLSKNKWKITTFYISPR